MTKRRGFSHLHVHSEYSILDGFVRIENLIDWTTKKGLGYVALTDHGNLYGVVHFYTKALEAGLKPIIGMEAYVSPTSRKDKSTPQDESSNHLILYAANSTGYKNLVRLASLAFIEGFHYKPRIDMELLKSYCEGIIVTTACMKGRVNQLFLNGNPAESRKFFEELISIFGKERLFLEYMNHGIPEQKRLRPHIESLSEEYKIPIIATNDAHYVNRSDARYQDIMMCIQMNKKISDPARLRFYNDQFYLKSWDEMLEAVEGNAEWLRNCDLVADLVDFKMDLGEFHFPTFDSPDGSPPAEYLTKKSKEGLIKRFNGDEIPDEYSQRLDYELKCINELGFAPYLLIIEDFVRFALEEGISKGPGRGSGAGSLVSYALGITDTDPIKYDLLFERFINPARKTMPDMDIDFDPIRREEVINYVRKKYGEERVCQIVTFNRLKARAAVRDSGRVLDIPLPDVDKVSKMIPFGFTIDKAMEITPEFDKLYKSSPGVKNWIDTAKAIEGLVRNVGVHPAGIVIADKPIIDYAPVMVSEKGGEIVAQYSMKDVEKIGLIKMDFLGLRTLTYIEDTIALVKRARGIEIDISRVPLDDKKTYKLLCDTDTLGVFQLESQGMRNLMSDIQPDRISDLIALIALYRPGPMKHAAQYAARKHKKEKITYAHPEMKPILEETYGVITYQEQITLILVELAGMPLPDAVNIIKIISKKRSAVEIDKYRGEFLAGTSSRGVNKTIANEVFDSIVDFAGYGFNKSHSAAYGLLAYWTAYLKANYPIEFYCAFLSSEMHSSDRISEILSELRRRKIEILPPDINHSYAGFTVEGASVRFGMVAIKGLGIQAVNSIVAVRQKSGDFTDLIDFACRIELHSINRGAIENLIKCGAMDCLPGNRAQKIRLVDRAIEIGKQKQEDMERGQQGLFDLATTSVQTGFAAYENMEEFTPEQKLRMEKELTGFYLSGHPLAPFRAKMKKRITHTIEKLVDLKDNDKVKICGLVTSLKFQVSKKKLERYAILRLEDFTGSIEVMVFPQNLLKYESQLAEESVLMMGGRINVNIREITDQDGETVETRQVKLILETAKKIHGPSDSFDIPDDSNGKSWNNRTAPAPATPYANVLESPDLDFSEPPDMFMNTGLGADIDAGISDIKHSVAELRISAPDDIAGFAKRLREILDSNPGETRINLTFVVGTIEIPIDLGETSLCNLDAVEFMVGREFPVARWSYK